MAHAPPFAARVRLVPVSADAGFAGAAIVEEDSGLTYLCPFHRILPFARMKAVLADVVLDDVGGMLAFEIADLAVDNEIILLVDLFDLQDHDVGGKLDHQAKAVRRLDIGICRLRHPGERQAAQHRCEAA